MSSVFYQIETSQLLCIGSWLAGFFIMEILGVKKLDKVVLFLTFN